MNKKIVVLGGGTGQSNLLRGLKLFPLDITAVVTVADDGRSSGKLRKVFNIPAVGDIRRVLVALAETEDVVEQMMNYRFTSNSEFDDQSVGNIMLTAVTNIYGNLSNGVKAISKILNLKGKVLPLTDENVVLMAKSNDGTIIEGEHNITESHIKIKKVFYKKEPKINKEVISSIKNSDAIILSMGSLLTSIAPNLIAKDVINAIDKSEAKIIYVCNIMTQPGETDNFTVSDHVNLLNKYLGKRKIDVVIVNNSKISSKFLKNYYCKEQKDPVILDKENVTCQIIKKPIVSISDDGIIHHDGVKLGLEILNYLLK